MYLRTGCITYTVSVYAFRVYTHSTCYSGYVSCTEIICGSGKPTKVRLCLALITSPIVCYYNDRVYEDGETFPAGDGCNTW